MWSKFICVDVQVVTMVEIICCSWTPPNHWSATRWQHGSCALPIPHVCLCQDTWSCMERSRHWCLHCVISYWYKIDSRQRKNTRTFTQGISCTRHHRRRNLPVPIRLWWSLHLLLTRQLDPRDWPHCWLLITDQIKYISKSHNMIRSIHQFDFIDNTFHGLI